MLSLEIVKFILQIIKTNAMKIINLITIIHVNIILKAGKN